MPPLSSSTPVRRSSPRLAVPADGNSETVISLPSSKPCYGTRTSLKRASADSNIVLPDGNKSSTSVAGSSIDQVEYRHRLRNSAIKSSQINGCMHDITEGTSLLSSRRFAVSDEELNDSKTDVSEPAVNPEAPPRRKRGWPKGVPRRKQVIHLLSW